MIRVVIMLALFAVSAAGQGVGIRSYWSSDTVKIGAPVVLRVEVSIPDGMIANFPKIQIDDPNADLLSVHYESAAAEYQFRFWSVGIIALPGIPVQITEASGGTRVFSTDSLFMVVSSSLTGSEQDIRAIKEMVPLRLTDTGSLLIKAGILVVLIILAVLLLRLRKTNNATAISQIRILNVTGSALSKLEGMRSGFSPEKSIEAYLQLSKNLRAFLQARFLFKALEMTSSEIARILPQEGTAPDNIALTVKLLEQCDLVKFAAITRSIADWNADLDRAADVIQRVGEIPRIGR